ncbi:MAG: hypothetical protein HQ522_02740 [Bacteroidetes bacterium]|nr:hypothetical protein [Bacteroidota bacterium]
MRLRIHHFFDIVRDFGSGKEISPHPHGNCYHTIAEEIRINSKLEFNLIVASDEICRGCSHLIDGVCDDVITHRTDFTGKEDFNNHLDKRIMEACGFEESKKYSPKLLCELAHKYLENIEYIYQGNDAAHTQKRKENVILGLIYYSEKHGFLLTSNH